MARRVEFFMDPVNKPKRSIGETALSFRARDSKGRFTKASSRRVVSYELYSSEQRKTVATYAPQEFRKLKKHAIRSKAGKLALSVLPGRRVYQSEHISLVSSLPPEALAIQSKNPPSFVVFHYVADGRPVSISVRIPGGSKRGSYRISTKFGKRWESNCRRWLIVWLKRFSQSAPQSVITPIGFEPFWPHLGDKT